MDSTFTYDMMQEMVSQFATGDLVLEAGKLLLVIALYVLRSIGLYAIAKRRGISNAWLAWIPEAWVWVVGSISDQFRYVTKAQVKNKRTTLLVMQIITFVMAVVLIVIVAINAMDLINLGVMGSTEDELMAEALVFVVKALGLTLLMCAVALAASIIQYIALYDLYMSVNPGNAVLFLVLSIVIGYTMPFFIFFNRKKDDGMPPRCDVPQVPVAYSYIPEPVVQEPMEISAEPAEEKTEE